MDREIVYQIRPYTIADRILLQNAGNGDYMSMAAFIKCRTDLTDDEILALLDTEAAEIIAKIAEAHLRSHILESIAKSFDAV